MTASDDHDPRDVADDTPREYRYRYKYLHKYGDLGPVARGADRDDHSRADGADPDDAGDDRRGHATGSGQGGDGDKNEKNEKNEKKDKDKDDDGDDESPEDRRKSRRKKILVIGSIAVVFVLAGIVWLLLEWLVFSQRETTDDAYVKGDQVAIASRIPGTVVAVAVEETDPVHAGQVLVRLDPADAEASLLQARGKLAQAVRQARVAEARAGQADAAVVQREAQYESVREAYARRHPLLDRHAVSREQVRDAEHRMRAASAALAEARKQAAAAHAQVDGVDIRQLPAVVQARAAFRTAWIDSSRNAIVSPVDGVAAKREVQVGQHVQPGQRLLTVVPLSHLWVDANFKEGQLTHLRIGQPAELTTELYPDVTFHGQVVGLNAGTGSAFSLLPAENATGNWIKVVQRLPVRISLDPRDLRRHPLRLGLSAEVKVDTHDRDGAVLRLTPGPHAVTDTAVYAREQAQADREAEAIIEANLGSAGTPAEGDSTVHPAAGRR
jgi:membrane fusion protein (multidrug efflux system)